MNSRLLVKSSLMLGVLLSSGMVMSMNKNEKRELVKLLNKRSAELSLRTQEVKGLKKRTA